MKLFRLRSKNGFFLLQEERGKIETKALSRKAEFTIK